MQQYKKVTSNAENSFASKPVFFQPKLTINQPNDVYEQEADAMADKVMRMQQPFIQAKPMPVTPVQRKCAHCEEKEKVQRKEINGEEATADASLENYIGGFSGSGQSLPNEVRNFYEPRFGYDFSNVKVHTDSVAAKSAQSINALAYTSGNNIVFNSGQFSPDTDTGKKLLGHELTHVVQQHSSTKQKKIQRQHHDSDTFSTGFSIEKLWIACRDCIGPFLEGVNSVLIFLCIFLLGITAMAAAMEVELAAAFAAFAATTSGHYIIAAFAALGLTSAISLILDSINNFYRAVVSATSRPELLSAGEIFCRNMGDGATEALLIIMPLIRTFPARLLRLFGMVPETTPSGLSSVLRHRIRPLNGRINVGGAFEVGSERATNLQPFIDSTGGPSRGAPVPNLVEGRFEEIAQFFEPESCSLIYSNRLRFGDVDWARAARGAFEVTAPGGRIRLNIWTESEREVALLIRYFSDAGFLNVTNGTGVTGSGTLITGMR